jgi:DNA-binding protein H-NS
VTEGVCSARQDTQHSNAGNVPLDETKKTWQGRGRFGRCITRLLCVCKLACYHDFLFCRVQSFILNLLRVAFSRL